MFAGGLLRWVIGLGGVGVGGGCFVGYFWLFSGLVCLGLLFGVRFGSVL